MDVVSYSLALKQAQRIEKFIENPDSNSGVITQPKVIEAGETVTIPAGRVAVLPNVVVDGDLIIEDGGDVFVPAGANFSDLDKRINTLSNSNINPMKMSDSNSYNTKILNRIGTGHGNVVQGFCIDKKNGALYTTHVSSAFVEGEEWAVINKFQDEATLFSVATHSTAPSNIIGHQGISIQYFNDEIKFWTSGLLVIVNI